MRKSFKTIFLLLLLTLTSISSMINVKAETAPDTMTASSYVVSKTPMSFPIAFKAKKASDGRYIYCTYYGKNPPISSLTFTKSTLITDSGMNYILNQAYGITSDYDFFVYQNALWIYMVDKGLMPGSYNNILTFKKQVYNSSSSAATQIKNIVAAAKSAGANDTTAPTISINASNATFELDSTGKYYVTDDITVISSTSSYSVKLTSGPSGTVIEKSGNKLIVKIPVDKITSMKTTINFTVSNSKNVYVSYDYSPNNIYYQTMAATYKETKTASANGSVTLTKEAKLSVLKIDASSKEAVSGATLAIIDSNGKTFDSWTTTTSAHSVKNLQPGTYTLKETKAPDGYIKSSTEIKFTVANDGTVKDANGNKIVQIKFENTKNGGATISKQDIADSKEIAGATLVVKDKDGKVVEQWVSEEGKSHYIELAPGTYTLTETQAPDGYILSQETITFTVKDDGSVTKVIMYNTKNGGVIISKQDITNGKEIADATLVVKDYDGNIIEEWVSEEGKSHYIELTPGIYTLTETNAPNGYILSQETITFTVKDDGTVTKVVMYNTPDGKEIPVENTASFKNITTYLAGIMIIVMGATIILKTSKKNKLSK